MGVRKAVLLLASIALAVLLASGLAPMQTGPGTEVSPLTDCSGVQVGPGDDIDAQINNAPDGTNFCVAAGTYQANNQMTLNGGKLIGPTATSMRVGPAYDPDPVATIVNASGVAKLVDASGTVEIRWLEFVGSMQSHRYSSSMTKGVDGCVNPGPTACALGGTGMIIGAAKTSSDSIFADLEMHNSTANCLTGISGRLLRSELYECDLDKNYYGFTSGAVKTTNEMEAAYNYLHDGEAFALWTDAGCDSVPERTNGFWQHHNVVVNNDHGIRYEHCPKGLATGGRVPFPSALIENNVISGNDGVGVSIHDSQNALVRNNTFGSLNIDGQSYAHNGIDTNAGLRAIQFTDSGRTDRTDLYNGDAYGNDLGGEPVFGCEKPDEVVDCHDLPP